MAELITTTVQEVLTTQGNALSFFLDKDRVLMAKDVRGNQKPVSQLLNSTPTGDQDNISIVKFINNYPLNEPPTLIEVLNSLPAYTVTEIQSLWIKEYVWDFPLLIDNQRPTLTGINLYKIVGVGKGTYGLDETQLTIDNILFVASNSLTLPDIENNPLTQIFTITDLLGLTVSEYINQLNPAEEFQDVDIAPRLIKVTQEGFIADYLFLPIGGFYGEGELQTTDSDFQLLTEEIPVSNNLISITYEQLEQLLSTNGLVKGAFYKISGVDQNLYDGTTILVQAINENTISEDGVGIFRNPQYNAFFPDFQLKIYNNLSTIQLTNIVGTIEYDAVMYGSLESVARLVGHTKTLFKPISGWSTDILSVFGDNFTADVELIEMPTYNVDEKVIWGGRVWNNVTGNLGAPLDDFNLNEDWEVLPFTDSLYKTSYDLIKYDYNGDKIIYRNEKNVNIVSTSLQNISNLSNADAGNPIKCFQWGNIYNSEDQTGIGFQNIVNSINNNINYLGRLQAYFNLQDRSIIIDCYTDTGSDQSFFNLKNSLIKNCSLVNNSSQDNLSFLDSSLRLITLDTSTAFSSVVFTNNSNLENYYYTQQSLLQSINYNNWNLPGDGQAIDNVEIINKINTGSKITGEDLFSINKVTDFIQKGHLDATLSYTEDEVNTGGTWIDGKPIYQKTFIIDNTGGGLLNISFFDLIPDLLMVVTQPYMYFNSGSDNYVGFYQTNLFQTNFENFNIQFYEYGSGAPMDPPAGNYIITANYTKSTD